MKVNYNYLRFKGLTHIVKEVFSYTNFVPRYKAKSLNREIKSQLPISMFGLKVWSYIFIIRKKYEKIPNECQDIRQSH